MNMFVKRPRLQAFLLAVFTLLMLGLTACFAEAPPSSVPSESAASDVEPLPEEHNWYSMYTSFYSNEEVQVIWWGTAYSDGTCPEHYLVERINFSTGKVVSSLPISMEYDPLSHVYPCGDYIAQRDILQKRLYVYHRDGELLRQWHVEGDSSTFPGVSGDLSKFLDITEAKQRLLVFTGKDSAVLWDSDRFDWFEDFFFFHCDFLGDNHIVFFGSTSDHRFYCGIIDLRRPEAMPMVIETRGDCRMHSFSDGYMYSRVYFYRSGASPLDYKHEHNADCLIFREGEDGELTQEYIPVPEAFKSAEGVFASANSPYKVYFQFDEDYDATLFVADPQGELYWQAHLKKEVHDVDLYNTGLISPDGKTLLINNHSNVWVVTEEKIWSLPFPDDR